MCSSRGLNTALNMAEPAKPATTRTFLSIRAGARMSWSSGRTTTKPRSVKNRSPHGRRHTCATALVRRRGARTHRLSGSRTHLPRCEPSRPNGSTRSIEEHATGRRRPRQAQMPTLFRPVFHRHGQRADHVNGRPHMRAAALRRTSVPAFATCVISPPACRAEFPGSAGDRAPPRRHTGNV